MRRLTRRPLPSLDQYTLEVGKIRPSHKRTKGIYPSYIYFDIGFIAESPDSYLFLKIRSVHHKEVHSYTVLLMMTNVISLDFVHSISPSHKSKIAFVVSVIFDTINY